MATSSVAITPGSGQAIAVDSNAGLASGAAVQIFSPANSDGSRQPFDPDGTLQVSPEATSLLLDDFGAQAITVFHTVASGNSGTTPSASSGNVSISAGTASGGYAVMRSTIALWLRAATFLRIAHIVTHETSATTNSTRWWGFGNNQTTPTATSPVINGAVFQLDSSAGALQAVTYSAGTKAVIATLTRLTDGLQHRYEVYYRQSIVYWLIDGAVVATKQFPNLAVATGLYAIAGSANAAAITAPTFSLSSVSVADQGGNSRTLADGFNPAIQATIKLASTAVNIADQALAVALHPSSPLPAGGNTIGGVNLNAGAQLIGGVRVGTSILAYSAISAATTNAAAIKAAAGTLHELTIANTTAAAIYVKLYNLAVAPTVGTSIPIFTFRVAATGSEGDFRQLAFGPNGKYFSIGISIAITAAVAATDTTVIGAGVQIHGTYSN